MSDWPSYTPSPSSSNTFIPVRFLSPPPRGAALCLTLSVPRALIYPSSLAGIVQSLLAALSPSCILYTTTSVIFRKSTCHHIIRLCKIHRAALGLKYPGESLQAGFPSLVLQPQHHPVASCFLSSRAAMLWPGKLASLSLPAPALHPFLPQISPKCLPRARLMLNSGPAPWWTCQTPFLPSDSLNGIWAVYI